MLPATENTTDAVVLMTLGGLFLVGLIADIVGRHSVLPRVTLLLLAGFAIGPQGLQLLPELVLGWFPTLTQVALAMVGFLLGQRLTLDHLRTLGMPIISMSLGEVLLTLALVSAGLYLVGVPLEIALILGAIAPATAPAAVVDVVREARAKGPFTDTLLGVVAIDDVWGLLLFSVVVAGVGLMVGNDGGAAALTSALWETAGAVVIGVLVGAPAAYLTGRIRPGEPMQAEALGVVLLAAGLASFLGVSTILCAVTLGTFVASFARHHVRPFHAIEEFEWPFLILFFLLAGSSLTFETLQQVGLVGVLYVVLRSIGRILGTRFGAQLCGAPEAMRRYLGTALLPQAGVAVGMALIAAQRFPEFAEVILPVILATTVMFELIGPIATRWALRRARESGQAKTTKHAPR